MEIVKMNKIINTQNVNKGNRDKKSKNKTEMKEKHTTQQSSKTEVS